MQVDQELKARMMKVASNPDSAWSEWVNSEFACAKDLTDLYEKLTDNNYHTEALCCVGKDSVDRKR